MPQLQKSTGNVSNTTEAVGTGSLGVMNDHSAEDDSVPIFEEDSVLPHLVSQLSICLFPGIGRSVVGICDRPRKSIQLKRQTLSYWLTIRFRILILLLGAVFVLMFINASLGMSIVFMVEGFSGMPGGNLTMGNDSLTSDCETMDWQPHIQGLILSAFSWGQLFSPLTGLLADYIDVKALVGAGVLLASALNATLPFIARRSLIFTILMRSACGFCDAIVQPSLNRFICVWFPSRERSSALSVVTAGFQLGVLVAFSTVGYICSRCDWYGGWPVAFLVPLAFVACWLPLWILWSSQRPQQHRRISRVEQSYIRRGTEAEFDEFKPATPWKKLLLSTALWANIAAIVCHEIPVAIIFVFLPQYMADVLHFDLARNSVLAGLPALTLMISKLASAQVSRIILNVTELTMTPVVKRFNFAASICLSLCLAAAAVLSSESPNAAFACFVLATAFAGMHTAGCICTPVTIAPQFSGTISGICFFSVGVASLLMPICVKLVVRTNAACEWNGVILTAAVIAALPTVFFTIYGSAEMQPWAVKHRNKSVRAWKEFAQRKDMRTAKVEENADFDEVKL